MQYNFHQTMKHQSVVIQSYTYIALKKKETPHECWVREGRHNWTFWRESLPKVLEFVTGVSSILVL